MKKIIKSKFFWILIIVIIALAVLWKFDFLKISSGQGKYQAVFLTNNQVYFGKLYKAKSSYPLLKDVYYLRVTQVLQPQDPNAPAQQIELVKLGNELHGPTNEMLINKDQILFIENLKEDSGVVQAIKERQASQK